MCWSLFLACWQSFLFQICVVVFCFVFLCFFGRVYRSLLFVWCFVVVVVVVVCCLFLFLFLFFVVWWGVVTLLCYQRVLDPESIELLQNPADTT